jgi:acyl-CoA synthetase (AMP-forming)/AMP-acid ligase II
VGKLATDFASYLQNVLKLPRGERVAIMMPSLSTDAPTRAAYKADSYSLPPNLPAKYRKAQSDIAKRSAS